MGVLTLKASSETVARSLELPGRVIMDPHLGGRVQAMQPGRIEPAGLHGLPAAGSRVKKGEVLAWVVPASGAIERSNQAATLADLKAGLGLAEKRLARLRDLADTVPQKEIDAAETEVLSLKGRIAAVGAGLAGREALVARLGKGETVNIEGYELARPLFDEISAIQLAGLLPQYAGETLIVQINQDAAPVKPELTNLAEANPRCSVQTVQEQPFWKETRAFCHRADELTRVTLRWLMLPI